MNIRQITSQDSSLFSPGVDLLNRTQGVGLFPLNYLELRTQDQKSYVVGAFHEDELVGIGIAQVIDTFDFYLPFSPLITTELNHKTVGSFSTLAIVENRQGQGIGQKISLERMNWLKAQGCQTILGVSWVSGLSHTSDRVFEKMGFKAIKRVEHFFKQMSLDNPFDCPGCRLAPCECAAILYRWDK